MVDEVTVVFTDVEGSTRLWDADADWMSAAMRAHDEALAEAFRTGTVIKHTGDGVMAVFGSPQSALEATIDAQRRLRVDTPLAVRMAIHTGPVRRVGDDVFGPTVNRCARLCDAGHGGQVLMSGETADLLGSGAPLKPLGRHRMRDLSSPMRLFQVLADELPDAFPQPRALRAFAHNLPVAVSSFVGRESEIADITRLLERFPLVSIVGAGGSGKTRLACQVAGELLDEFDGGCWFVDLVPARSSSDVVPAVGGALGVEVRTTEPLESLFRSIGPRRLLLVLDNCEHVVEGAAEFAGRASQTGFVSVLATSRRPLRSAAEKVFRLGALPVDGGLDHPADALRLLEDRALDVGEPLDWTRDRQAAESLCDSLAGIPLAIELAAARLRTMSLEELNRDVHRSISVLDSGLQDDEWRHHTLAAALEWSYQLLSEAGQRVIGRLAIFPAGWDRAAARSVCGDELAAVTVDEAVSELVDLCLIEKSISEAGDTKLQMLEPVRQFASGLVGPLERSGVERRLVDHYADIARRESSPSGEAFGAVEFIRAGKRDRILTLGRRFGANIVASIDLAFDQERPDDALRMIATFGAFLAILSTGYLTRVEGWLAAAEAHLASDPELALDAMMAVVGALSAGTDNARYLEVATAVQDVAAGLGVEQAVADLLFDRAYALRRLGDFEASEALHDEVIAASVGDHFRHGHALIWKSVLGFWDVGAVEMAHEGWAELRAGGIVNNGDLPDAHNYGLDWWFAEMALNQGRFHESLEAIGRGFRTIWADSSPLWRVHLLASKAQTLVCMGKTDEAWPLVDEALAIGRGLPGNTFAPTLALSAAVAAAEMEDDPHLLLDYIDEWIACSERTFASMGAAHAYAAKAALLGEEGDLLGARHAAEASARLLAAMERGQGPVNVARARIALSEGNGAAALGFARELFDDPLWKGLMPSLLALELAAAALAAIGESNALRLWRALDAKRAEIGAAMLPWQRRLRERFAMAERSGERVLTIEEAVDLATPVVATGPRSGRSS